MNQADGNNACFLVIKRGKPEIVILNVADYLGNVVKDSKLLTKVQRSEIKAGLDRTADDEIEAEINAYRKEAKL